MKIADQKLLLAFAKLMLRIAHAKNPTASLDVTEATVNRSAGYKRLRSFFLDLSPRKRDGFRRMMRNQIDGVKALIAEAERTGEKIDLGDIVIEWKDAETGDTVPDAPNVQLETAEPEAAE